MTKLTIDIGIRNLAMCIMGTDDPSNLLSYRIHLWDVYNLLDDGEQYCDGIQKSGKICGSKCGYKYKDSDIFKYSCKKHVPKGVVPGVYKKKLMNDLLLQDIAKLVNDKIQSVWDTNKDLFSSVTDVIIELQLKVNPKMKFISHVLFGKFTDLYSSSKTNIRFIGASNKLKAYTGPEIICTLKDAKARRKWATIQHTKWFLETRFSVEERDRWLPKFLKTPKQDDMSDVFCYMINALHGTPPKAHTKKKSNPPKKNTK